MGLWSAHVVAMETRDRLADLAREVDGVLVDDSGEGAESFTRVSVRTRKLNMKKGKLASSRASLKIGEIGLVKVDLELQIVELVEQVTRNGALELDGREGSAAGGSDREAGQLLTEKLIVSSSSVPVQEL